MRRYEWHHTNRSSGEGGIWVGVAVLNFLLLKIRCCASIVLSHLSPCSAMSSASGRSSGRMSLRRACACSGRRERSSVCVAATCSPPLRSPLCSPATSTRPGHGGAPADAPLAPVSQSCCMCTVDPLPDSSTHSLCLSPIKTPSPPSPS